MICKVLCPEPRYNSPLFQKGKVEKGQIPSPFSETGRMLDGGGCGRGGTSSTSKFALEKKGTLNT